ncbi:hypothetical protein AKO1_006055 [Acrasis kona]|uniref:Uncharacterized protein n=1 Tax=Acrasis kona TaxID=1008807 RepID=A0AAW2YH89_9EUKA
MRAVPVVFLLATIISFSYAALPVFKFVCNLTGNNWLSIASQPCQAGFTIVIPVGTRVIATGGPIPSACGKTYYTVFVDDINAGYAEAQYLCDGKIPYTHNDRITGFNWQAGWDFINMFQFPSRASQVVERLNRGEVATVVDGPAYTNENIYMVKVANGRGFGWVDATYIQLTNYNMTQLEKPQLQ